MRYGKLTAAALLCLCVACIPLMTWGCTSNHGGFGFEQSTKWGFYNEQMEQGDEVDIDLKPWAVDAVTDAVKPEEAPAPE